MKSEFYYTSSLRGRRSKGKGKGIKKEKGSRKAAPVQFTVVGVQKIYQGDTVSYIMTEMFSKMLETSKAARTNRKARW